MVITDGWRSHSELEKMGYIHKIQRAIVKEEDEEILPNVYPIFPKIRIFTISLKDIKNTPEKVKFKTLGKSCS